MGRKKKKDTTSVIDTLTEAHRDIKGRLDISSYTTTAGLAHTYGIHPYTVTQEGDTWVYSPSITSYPSHVWSTTTLGGTTFPSLEELQKKLEKEVIGDVNLINVKSSNKYEHIVACRDENDLSVDRVLKVLSATKGKIMIDVAPVHVKELECSITPAVRKNIVTASKKLKMYGKRRPIISRYDEWGNPLPDEIELGTEQGVTLKIVDPEKYGEFYFELKAIEFPSVGYETYSSAPWEAFEEDIPF